jgi:hypothetical protein
VSGEIDVEAGDVRVFLGNDAARSQHRGLFGIETLLTRDLVDATGDDASLTGTERFSSPNACAIASRL